MKKALKFFLKPFLGKKFMQGFFSGLFLLGIKGMNFGGGATYSESGEEWVLNYLAKKTQQPAVVFDGGANLGDYAQMVRKIFDRQKKSVKIYCFEPSKSTFGMLQKNARGYPSIIANNIGLGETEGQATLYSDKAGSGLASVYDRDLAGQHHALGMSEQVNITTVDSFCRKNGIGRIDFLKLDIEGHELAALKGSPEMLKKRAIQAIQFEFGGTDIDARAFFRDFYNLLSPDFNLYRVLQNGLYPLKQYREIDEIFVTTNYFAELKN